MFLDSMAAAGEVGTGGTTHGAEGRRGGANLRNRVSGRSESRLRQPVHALNLYLGGVSQMEMPLRAATMLGKVRQCARIMDEMFRTLLDISELDAGRAAADGAVRLSPLFARPGGIRAAGAAKGIDLRVRRCSGYARSIRCWWSASP